MGGGERREVVFGAVVLGESMTPVTIVSIAAILLGVIGLKISVGDGNEDGQSSSDAEVIDAAG